MKTIPLTRGYVALVDDADYDRVAQHKWCAWSSKAQNSMYAQGKAGTEKNILMHRFILGCSGSVDHADGNGLNNQRYNLRPATRSENGANRPKFCGKSSQFKGVSWSKNTQKWKAEIRKAGKSTYIGVFREECDAAQAYNLKALELFGEFANYNSPPHSAPLG